MCFNLKYNLNVMKSIKINLILLLLFFSACRKETISDVSDANNKLLSQNSPTLGAAITSSNDPNLDANWSFWDPNLQKVRLYYGNAINNQPINFVDEDLPWNTMGNPVNFDRDFTPDLGWVLYLRDFGTPERPAPVPFFALYNKYSGILRFFIYNYKVNLQHEQAKTYYIGELGFVRTDITGDDREYNSSLFVYAPPGQSSEVAINPQNRQIVVSRKDVSTKWLNFDFNIGYDLSSTGEFHLQIKGASESDINLSTDFSTLTATSSVGTTTTSFSNFGKVINNGYEYISAADGLLSTVDKIAKPSTTARINSKLQTFGTTKNMPVGDDKIESSAIGIGTIAAAVSVIKGGIGLVKTFVGGRSSVRNTQTSIHYSGIVKTSGTSTLSVPLYNLQFTYSPNKPHASSRYVPLFKSGNFNDGIGLFNAPYLNFGGSTHLGLIIDEHRFKPCQGEVIWSYADFKVPSIKVTGGFDSEVAKGNLRIDSVNISLINKAYINGTREGQSSFFFLYQTAGLINGVNKLKSDDKQTKWVINNQTNGSSFYLPIIDRYYLSANSFLDLGTMVANKSLWPLIGIEVQYTITDPKYKSDESRTRVFYKVLEIGRLQYYLTEYDGRSLGCPYLPTAYPLAQ